VPFQYFAQKIKELIKSLVIKTKKLSGIKDGDDGLGTIILSQ
jgi:hypothetical protein